MPFLFRDLQDSELQKPVRPLGPRIGVQYHKSLSKCLVFGSPYTPFFANKFTHQLHLNTSSKCWLHPQLYPFTHLVYFFSKMLFLSTFLHVNVLSFSFLINDTHSKKPFPTSPLLHYPSQPMPDEPWHCTSPKMTFNLCIVWLLPDQNPSADEHPVHSDWWPACSL